jgi:O-methyltransferase
MNNNNYIELLKKVLLDLLRSDDMEYKPVLPHTPSFRLKILLGIHKLLCVKKYAIVRSAKFDIKKRYNGLDWPANADTMIGLKRLENIEFCFREVIKDNVPGDFIETGVWRGGATIFMRALLRDANIKDRTVWVADSFEGLPKADEEKYTADKGSLYHKMTDLAIPIEVVKRNFEKYNLLDENVQFLKGWFKDTLPAAPIKSLAILRLDGDMYGSTMDGLVNLYPKLSPGGFTIIDDWGAEEPCKQAVIDYRQKHNITETIKDIDGSGVYWRKER